MILVQATQENSTQVQRTVASLIHNHASQSGAKARSSNLQVDESSLSGEGKGCIRMTFDDFVRGAFYDPWYTLCYDVRADGRFRFDSKTTGWSNWAEYPGINYGEAR